MENNNNYVEYAVTKAVEILNVPSPSGYTSEVIKKLKDELKAIGYASKETVKGGLLVDLGGSDSANGVLLMAHVDTLGGMVAEIKDNGRLRIVSIGGLNANNTETENCHVMTKFSGELEGTFQLINASTHVNKKYSETLRKFEEMEVVLDEDVEDKEDVEALGVSSGDFVCFDPRTRVTESGYIKSRFLDDKLSVGILLAYAKYLKDEAVVPERRVFCTLRFSKK